MHDRSEAPPGEVQPTTIGATSPALTVIVAAAASLGAGLVHAAAAGTHSGADSLVRLFAVTAALQVGWAGLAIARASRPVLGIGFVLNGACVVAWALSRTRGLPWPAELEVAEEVGTQDTIAAVLGAVAALGALAGLVRPRLVRRRSTPVGTGAAVAGFAVLALAVPGMAAPHEGGAGHDHGGGADHHAAGAAEDDHGGDGHSHAAGTAADDEGHAHDEAGPVISLDDERVSDEQRVAAQALIDDTTAGMARFSDTGSVQAAGYISIGDAVTGYEHFINVGYIADGIELDPDKIESIVFTVAPDGTRTLASAMYIMNFGSTMDDVPDIAGELTTWHDHQNLCWEGATVVGTTDATGSCERGTFRATPPMLHVWMVENECGPFAGIEGSHGTSCAHTHTD
jgi:hypothetical protein